MTSTIYKELIAIAEDYLGPAANRFVDRIVDSHLHKDPAQLQSSDIPKLVEWFKVTLGLLTNDKRLIDECEKRILKLSHAR